MSEPNNKFLNELYASGKKIIFELDDWLPAMPASHSQFFEFDPYALSRTWREQLHFYSVATVSTEAIAVHLRQYLPDVRVLPNALAAQRYQSLQSWQHEKGAPITIGFAGTSTHEGDVKIIIKALSNIQKKYGEHSIRFVFWGVAPVGFEGANNIKVVQEGVPYPLYLEKLNSLKLDIALAPLEDNLFNQCKSDLKWLEYTAAGAACILSDVAPYQEAKALGLAEVVENDTASWEAAIIRLIEDDTYRQSLQRRSYDYLQRYATLDTQAYQWVNLLRDLLDNQLAGTLDSYEPRHASVELRAVGLMTHKNFSTWQSWRDRHQLREIDAEMMAERMMRQWNQQPEYLLIMPVRYSEREALAASIESLQRQLYRHWKLIVVADWAQPDPIFNSNNTLGWLQLDSLDDPQLYTQALNGLLGEIRCDWVMLLPAGTMLVPQLLLRMGDIAHSQPQSLAIYTDHDCYTQPDSFVQPALKPDFSLDYLRAYDYIGGAVALSFRALASLGGFDPYPSCEVWNHLLRLAENYGLDVIQHIDEVLMHLPARAPGERHEQEAARHVALENHLQRLGIEATVSKGFVDNTLHVDYRVTGQPLVSIIIPTRDKLEYLQPCVESLFERTKYQNFELLIVDNASQNPDTFHFYQDIERDHPNQIRIIDYPQPFNFSAQCNLGVEQARGEYIVLLNNDTEIIQSEWLERMIGLAQRPEVGAVGVRLAYPEIGRIQHAGIVLGLPGGVLSVADHVFEKEALDAPGYMNRLLTEQNYSAVTAACLMVSKQKYQQIGGFDAADLTVLFNDVDFCLKLQKQGLINVYTPYVTLVHHHAKSIGKQTYEPEVALTAAVRERKELKIMLKRWLPRLAYDPAYNRHLTLCDKNMGIEPSRYANWAPHQVGRAKVLGIPIAGASGEYRVAQPFQALQQGGRLDAAVIPGEKNSIPIISVVDMARLNPEVVLVHSLLTDGMQYAIKQYREFLPDIRLVFGLDDLVGAMPEKSILHRVWRKTMPDSRTRLRNVLKYFDSVIVSTEPLRDACRDMNDDIIVIPNRLSRRMWGEVSSLRGQGRKPRVGWVGAMQHQGDLAEIIDVVKETAEEVEWVFMGMCLPELRPYIAEEYPCIPFQTYPDKMASLNLDLAIAPLEINAFNESKSNLRLLEYGVMSWPVICSDIFPYQTNGAPVCRVPNTAKAWVAAIRERIYDLDAAYREGDQLRRWVDRDYWLEDHLDDWYQSLLGGIDKK
ncbi:glycosyltransferase [Paludibacterium denitrificans]|uniref:Glycosyltransferase n=1 Tax=Paludibacterium denitrificans TaxID=2675226 RepID=A0A844GCA8_9NEIS|nr:glycosyltransferase [Paludibacterium denitrificans]MTD32868.1 glycosyltransferase [Paludibacterium denitrificans]